MEVDPSTSALVEGVQPPSAELPSRLVSIRRRLHMHPEVGMREVETSRFIRQTLELEGFAVTGPLADTGLFVDIEGEHPGPMIAYRADMDALPIQDAKEVPYASQNPGVAHLCGHDAHTAVAIGVALSLREHRSELKGSVRVFFQPDEESTPSGAPLMIRDGVLNGVEAAYCIHVDSHLSVGQFGLSYGAVTAASDTWQIAIGGPATGHTARPHEAVDTIWVATQIMNSLYQLTGRVHDVRNSAVFTLGFIHGGSAHNVIPDRVEFGGTLRCIDPEDRLLLRRQIIKNVESISSMYGARADCRLLEGSPAVINTPHLVRGVEETIRAMWGEEAVVLLPRPSMGAEDFAYYLEHVPGVLVRVGSADGPNTSFPLHDARFDIGEDALGLGCSLMTQVLINDLETRSRR